MAAGRRQGGVTAGPGGVSRFTAALAPILLALSRFTPAGRKSVRGISLGDLYSWYGNNGFHHPRIETASADSYFEGSPELAIKVISPKDSAADIQTKVQQYLAFGALQVWVLYPKTREVQVFGANLHAVTLPAGAILLGCPVLPDVAVSVGRFFAV
jgi:hypothetical protein